MSDSKTEIEALKEQLVLMDGQLAAATRAHRGVLVGHSEDRQARLSNSEREYLLQDLAKALRNPEGAALLMPPGWKLDWLMSAEAVKSTLAKMSPDQRLCIIAEYCLTCGLENIERCSCGSPE